MRRITLAVVIVCVCTSCSMVSKSLNPSEASPPEERAEKAPHADNLEFYPTASRSEIEERFGKPLSIKEETLPNKHDPDITDSLVEYSYDGLRFSVYHASYGDRDFIVKTDVTKSGFRTEAGISVGDTEAMMRESYPDIEKDGAEAFVFIRFLSADSPVARIYRFEMKNGLVERITITLEGL